MLFCLYVDRTGRAVLDDNPRGDVLAVIEGKDWQEARREAEGQKVLDAFGYRAGWGWFKQKR